VREVGRKWKALSQGQKLFYKDKGNLASALYMASGFSGIRVMVGPGENDARAEMVDATAYKKRLLAKGADENLIEKLQDLRIEVRHERAKRKQIKEAANKELEELQNDPIMEFLEQVCDHFGDLWEYLYLVSKNPPIFEFSAIKKHHLTGDLFPKDVWEQLRTNKSLRRKKDYEFRKSHESIKDIIRNKHLQVFWIGSPLGWHCYPEHKN